MFFTFQSVFRSSPWQPSPSGVQYLAATSILLRSRSTSTPTWWTNSRCPPPKMVLFFVLLTTSWTSHQSRSPAPSVELPQRRQHGKDHLEQAGRELFFPGAQHQHAGQETCGQLSVSGTGKHVLVVSGVVGFSRIKTPSEDCLLFQNNHRWPCLGNPKIWTAIQSAWLAANELMTMRMAFRYLIWDLHRPIQDNFWSTYHTSS